MLLVFLRTILGPLGSMIGYPQKYGIFTWTFSNEGPFEFHNFKFFMLLVIFRIIMGPPRSLIKCPLDYTIFACSFNN